MAPILAVDPYISLNNSGKFKHDLRARFQISDNRFPVREQNNSDAYSFYAEYQMNYKLADFMSITAGLTENYSKVISNFYGDHTGLNIAGFTQFELNPITRG